jgi:hypothetical protein
MKKTKKDQKPTTISADPSVRDALKQIAEKMGITQRKCLSLIMDEKVHRDKVNSRKKREEFEQLDLPDAINQINHRLEKIEKRENPRDTIVSFFRTQEKEILKPMSAKVELIYSKLQDILDALKSIQ